jgi:hypothetical protein
MRFAPTISEFKPRSIVMTPTEIVQRQLDAYNAHDLDRFADCFSEDVRIFRMPTEAPSTVGRAALRAFYAEKRFSIPGLRAELLNRIELGNKVTDHERIHGLHEQPSEVIGVYRIIDGLIADVWFFYP